MIFRLGTRTPLVVTFQLRWLSAVLSGILIVLFASCGGSSSHPSHNAYISFPSGDTIGLFHIDNASGEIAGISNSVPLTHTGPQGLALHPSGKFLYAANSAGNSVSVYNVAGDGSLSQNGTPVPAGVSPFGAVIDHAGAFLLVTNTISNSISVFSIDSGNGALTLTNTIQGLPNPTQIIMTPSGNYVYVVTPSTNNTIWGFTYSSGTLTPISGSPYQAGHGTNAVAVDPGEQFLYGANTTDNTISGFLIDNGQQDGTPGRLIPTVGSPYVSSAGNSPSALAVDTTGKFLFVSTAGSSNSIWVFTITPLGDPDPGALNQVSTPFSFSAGGVFLLMEPMGKYFYIGSLAGNVAGYTYDPNVGTPTAITGSPFGVGSAPGSMIITQ